MNTNTTNTNKPTSLKPKLQAYPLTMDEAIAEVRCEDCPADAKAPATKVYLTDADEPDPIYAVRHPVCKEHARVRGME